MKEGHDLDRCRMLEVMHKGLSLALASATIQDAWERSGLWPFDKNVPLCNACLIDALPKPVAVTARNSKCRIDKGPVRLLSTAVKGQHPVEKLGPLLVRGAPEAPGPATTAKEKTAKEIKTRKPAAPPKVRCFSFLAILFRC